MVRLGSPLIPAAVAALLVAAWPGSTRADTRTLVLHIEARGADASLADVVDEAVRHAVDSTPSSELASLAVSPESLRGALRCNDLDARCLSAAAARTSVDRILFGEVEGADTYTRAHVRLRLYDAFLGEIVEAPSVELSSIDRSGLALGAASLAASLLAVPLYGALRVEAEPGATVFLDGQRMDRVPTDGSLEIFPVRIGRHELRIGRPDGRRCELPVHVRAREIATAFAPLAAGDDALLSAQGLPHGEAVRANTATASRDRLTIVRPSVRSVGTAPRDALHGPVATSRPQTPLINPNVARYGIPIDGALFLNGSVGGGGAKVVAKIRF